MPRFVFYRTVGSSTINVASGDVPFPISGLAAGNYEVNDGLAWRGPFTVTAPAPTPTPTPAPQFTTQPSVSPSSGTAGTTTFTATPGTVSNGTISSRAWLLNGTSVSTGTTFSPTSGQAGTATYQETATGAGGTAQSAIQSVTIAAPSGGGTPTPTPTPAVSDTFDGTDGALLTSRAANNGGTWQPQPGVTIASGNEPVISGGEMWVPGSATGAAYQLPVDLAAAQYAEAEIKTLTIGTSSNQGAFIGVLLRASSTEATYYNVRQRIVGPGATNPGVWEVYRFRAGTGTLLGTFATSTNMTGTKRVRVEARDVGSTVEITATVDGASLGAAVVDSGADGVRINTGGRVGFRATYGPATGNFQSTATAGVHFTDFVGGAL